MNYYLDSDKTAYKNELIFRYFMSKFFCWLSQKVYANLNSLYLLYT